MSLLKNLFSFKIISLWIFFFICDLKDTIRFRGLINLFKFYTTSSIINYFFLKKKLIPRNKEFINFLNLNLKKWKIKKPLSKKRILVTGFVHLPTYYLQNAFISKFLEEYYKFNSIGLLEEHDHMGYHIYKSFDIKDIFFLKRACFFDRIKFFKQSIDQLKNKENIEDILKLKINSIFIGKSTYDHYIRHTGNCSLEKKNFQIYYILSKALNINYRFKKILNDKKFNIKFLVQSELQFIPSSIIFQNCIFKNIKVYSRSRGPKWIGVTKFNNSREIFSPRDKVDPNYFYNFYKKYRKKTARLGFKIIRKRILGDDKLNLKAWGINNAKKHKILNKSDLCKIYNWDHSKPIVCIFSHCFVDGNYSQGWRLFKDNLTWLKETLNIIKTIDNINWIIKTHPLEENYKTTTTTATEVKNISKIYKHIKLCDVKISNSSLAKNISAAVSSHGTAPLEYGSFGIPSIVAGNTKYSYLNFLNTAKTLNQYKWYLKNTNKLKKINKNQIDKIHTWSFLAYKLFLLKNEIVPDIFVLKRLKDYNLSKYWEIIGKNIKKLNRSNINSFKMMYFSEKNKLNNVVNLSLFKKIFIK